MRGPIQKFRVEKKYEGPHNFKVEKKYEGPPCTSSELERNMRDPHKFIVGKK